VRRGKEGIYTGSIGRRFPATHGSKPSAHTHDENCSSIIKHSSETIRLCHEYVAETDCQAGTSTVFIRPLLSLLLEKLSN